MANKLYIAGYYANGNPTGSPTKSAKVWKFDGSTLTDISTGLSGNEAICLASDSTTHLLYVGCSGGKIYKYSGSSWSLEYDTGDSTRSIMSLVYFNSKWWALASSRPKLDSNLACVVWRRDGPGNWTVTKAAGSGPALAATCMETLTGNDGTFLLINTHNPGQPWYSSDGSTFTRNTSLSQASQPLGHPVIQPDAGTPYYVINNVDTGNSWRATTINGSFGGGGLGRPGGVNNMNYGPHATVTYKGQYYIMDYQYNRVYSLVLGAGWSSTQVDLPGGSLSGEWRSGFVEHDDGELYAIAEAYKGSLPYYESFIYSTATGAPGVTGTSGWTQDYYATGRTGGDNFLDILSAEDFVVALQFRRNQIKDGEIIQDHHEYYLAHSVRVDFSVMKDDQPSAPPGSPVVGDTYWLRNAGAASGAWASFTQNDVLQYSNDGTWVKLTAGMTDGEKIRIAASPATTASFSGWGGQLAEWSTGDSAFVNNLTPVDGVQVVETGYSNSYWYHEPMVWDANNGDYESIGAAVSIDTSDNALLFDIDKLKHREQLGHDWTNPNGYNPGIVLGTTATGAGAAAVAKYTYIATTGASWAHPSGGTFAASAGDYIYNNFGTWVKVGSRADGDLLAVPPAGATGSFAGNENKIAIWNATSATYTFIDPHAGDLYSAGDPETATHVWRDIQAFYNGTQWRIFAQDPDKIDSDTVNFTDNREFVVVTASGLTSDANGVKVDLATNGGIQYAQINGSLQLNIKSNSGLTLDANGLYVGPTASTTAISASNPVADKQYVLNQLQGLDWQSPAQVLKVRDDLHSAGPTSPYTGLAMIAASGTTGNWASFTENDLLEWSGSTWVKITSVASGTRVVVAATGATGSFSTYDNYVADLSGSTWAFTGPQDGWAILINGENGYYENTQWVYDSTPTGWTQVGAQQIYSASGGLHVANNKFELDFVMDSRTPTQAATGVSFTGLSIKGSVLVDTYVSMYRNGQKLLRNDAGPTIGEFKWDNGNSHAYVAASDAFQANETMEIVAFGKP